jgi:hypothetical protein
MSKPISLYSYCGSGICIEQDREKDELPAHMTCVSEAEIRKVHSSAGSNHFIFFYTLSCVCEIVCILHAAWLSPSPEMFLSYIQLCLVILNYNYRCLMAQKCNTFRLCSVDIYRNFECWCPYATDCPSIFEQLF